MAHSGRALCLLAVLLVAGCANAAVSTKPDKSVLDVLKANKLNTVVAIIQKLNRTAEFSNLKWKGTLFAPTDAAFVAKAKELGQDVSALLVDTNALAQVFNYHIVPNAAYKYGSLKPTMRLQTSIPSEFIRIGKKVAIIDSNGFVANITKKDLFSQPGKKGVVQVIDGVLLPSLAAPSTGNLYEVIAKDPELSTLKAALDASNLATAAQNLRASTLFAPTNKAWADLLSSVGMTQTELFADSLTLVRILTYHIIPGVVFQTGSAVDGQNLTTLMPNGTLTVNLKGKQVVIMAAENAGTIVKPDVMAGGSALQVVDKVLLPSKITKEQNILDVAKTIPELSIFVEAIEATVWKQTISTILKYATVFAPTNDAFNALFKKLNVTKEDLFTKKNLDTYVLLANHFVPGVMTSAMLTNGTVLSTLSALDKLTVDRTGDVIDIVAKLSEGKVIKPDIVAGSNIIHMIDNVLMNKEINVDLTPPKTIIQVCKDNNLTVFLEAVDKAGLTMVLDQITTTTVFAPTNAAFDQLFDALDTTKEDAFSNIALVIQVVTYHVAPANYLDTASMKDGQSVNTMLLNGVLKLAVTGSATSDITIKGAHSNAKIITPNIKADTDLVHIIDNVLIPDIPGVTDSK